MNTRIITPGDKEAAVSSDFKSLLVYRLMCDDAERIVYKHLNFTKELKKIFNKLSESDLMLLTLQVRIKGKSVEDIAYEVLKNKFHKRKKEERKKNEIIYE